MFGKRGKPRVCAYQLSRCKHDILRLTEIHSQRHIHLAPCWHCSMLLLTTTSQPMLVICPQVTVPKRQYQRRGILHAWL